MPSGYRHLTRYDRCQIQALKKSSLSQRAIAVETGRPEDSGPAGPAERRLPGAGGKCPPSVRALRKGRFLRSGPSPSVPKTPPCGVPPPPLTYLSAKSDGETPIGVW